jgi:hypothetical protein
VAVGDMRAEDLYVKKSLSDEFLHALLLRMVRYGLKISIGKEVADLPAKYDTDQRGN